MKEGMAEIISTEEKMKKLLQANKIIIDTSLEKYLDNQYVRMQAPESCGWDKTNDFYITRWERCGS